MIIAVVELWLMMRSQPQVRTVHKKFQNKDLPHKSLFRDGCEIRKSDGLNRDIPPSQSVQIQLIRLNSMHRAP